MRYFASLDIGTSFLKGAIFNSSLRVLNPPRTYKIESNSPLQLPTTTWNLCIQCVRELLSPCKLTQDDTLSISISGNGPTLVYLGIDNRVLACTLWNSSEFLVLQNETSYYLPFVEYIRRKNPSIFSQVRLILPLAEYISFCFCARAATFVPHKMFLPYLWSKESIQRYQLPATLFPPAMLSGTTLGPINPKTEDLIPEIANLGSAAKNVLVLCGGLDYLAALVGSASVKVGDICIRSGTSTVVNFCFDEQNTKKHLEKEPDHTAYPSFVLPHPIVPRMNIGITIPFFHDFQQGSDQALQHCSQDTKSTHLYWKFFSSLPDSLSSFSTHDVRRPDDLFIPFHRRLKNNLASFYPQLSEVLQKSLSSLTLLLFLIRNTFLQFKKQFDSEGAGSNSGLEPGLSAKLGVKSSAERNARQLTEPKTGLEPGLSAKLNTGIVAASNFGHVSYSGRKNKHSLFYTYLASVLQTKINLYEAEYCELRGNIIFALVQEHGKVAEYGEHNKLGEDTQNGEPGNRDEHGKVGEHGELEHSHTVQLFALPSSSYFPL